jgi:hypothetical protein
MATDDWGTWSPDVAGGTLSTSDSQGSSLFGFTESDWFSDVKGVANLWGYINNGGALQEAGQNQSDMMYSIEKPTNPSAQYIDPRAQPASAIGGINKTYIIAGIGALALVYVALK